MGRSEFLSRAARNLGLAAMAPLALAVLLLFSGAGFMGFPLGVVWGVGMIGQTVGTVLAVLLLTALAVWMPNYALFVTVSVGVPAAVGLIAGAGSPQLRGMAAAVAGYLSLAWPVAVAGWGVYREGGRRALRRGGWGLLVAVGLLLVLSLAGRLGAVGLLGGPVWMVVVMDAIILGRFSQQYPPVDDPPARVEREAKVAGIAFALLLAGVLLSGWRVQSGQARLALAAFQARHPGVAVTPGRVERVLDYTVVHLQGEDWVYRVTLRGDQVVDDGFAQREAAQVAAAWAVKAGFPARPVPPEDVRFYGEHRADAYGNWAPFPGALAVSLRTERANVAVYRGRIIRTRLLGGQDDPLVDIAGLLSGHFRDRLPTNVSISLRQVSYAWDHGDGLWEYGLHHFSLGYAYVMIRDGQVVRDETGLTLEEWIPPH